MAERTIDQLEEVYSVSDNDLLLLQHGQTANKLKGNALKQYINRNVVEIDTEIIPYGDTPVSTYDRTTNTLHMQVNRGPGIQSIDLNRHEGLDDYYDVITQDDEVAGTFKVTNGLGTVNSVMGVSPDSTTHDILRSELMALIYPIGSIYITADSRNPHNIFGMGTWEKIEGRFLLGSSSSHTLGSTGGEENHTLTTSEIPSHTHGMTGVTDTPGTYNAWGVVTKYAFVVSGSTYIENTTAAGGGGSHNNMPPYYTVNIWRRTA